MASHLVFNPPLSPSTSTSSNITPVTKETHSDALDSSCGSIVLQDLSHDSSSTESYEMIEGGSETINRELTSTPPLADYLSVRRSSTGGSVVDQSGREWDREWDREREQLVLVQSPIRRRKSVSSVQGGSPTILRVAPSSPPSPGIVYPLLTPIKDVQQVPPTVTPRPPSTLKPKLLPRVSLNRKQSYILHPIPLSPIPDATTQQELSLDPKAATFIPPSTLLDPISSVPIAQSQNWENKSIRAILMGGKDGIGELTREARESLRRRGVKVISAMHGPGSLPYARCPSGIDAYTFTQDENDPFRQQMIDVPTRYPQAKRHVSVPLPGNARYSQPSYVKSGRIPGIDGSLISKDPNGFAGGARGGGRSVSAPTKFVREKIWVEDEVAEMKTKDDLARELAQDRRREKIETGGSFSARPWEEDKFISTTSLFDNGIKTTLGIRSEEGESYLGTNYSPQIPLGTSSGLQSQPPESWPYHSQYPYLPYPFNPLSIPLSMPLQMPYFLPYPPNLDPSSYPLTPSQGLVNSATPLFDPAIVSIGAPILSTPLEPPESSTTMNVTRKMEQERNQWQENETEEEMLKDSGFYFPSPPVIRRRYTAMLNHRVEGSSPTRIMRRPVSNDGMGIGSRSNNELRSNSGIRPRSSGVGAIETVEAGAGAGEGVTKFEIPKLLANSPGGGRIGLTPFLKLTKSIVPATLTSSSSSSAPFTVAGGDGEGWGTGGEEWRGAREGRRVGSLSAQVLEGEGGSISSRSSDSGSASGSRRSGRGEVEKALRYGGGNRGGQKGGGRKDYEIQELVTESAKAGSRERKELPSEGKKREGGGSAAPSMVVRGGWRERERAGARGRARSSGVQVGSSTQI